MRSKRLGAAAAVCLTAGACASTSPLVRQQCFNPEAQLASVLVPFEAARARGCDAAALQSGKVDGVSECDSLQREIERLALVCQGHAPTLMANAVIAYDQQRPATSQQYLDEILAQPRPYPDAAALRARISIEEGNVAFARRLLEQQITLVPDHAGLHETLASAFYLDGKLTEARTELTLAGALGAPRWRIAYHLGLIEEGQGRQAEATRLYDEALKGNPGWVQAESRLRAIRARSEAR